MKKKTLYAAVVAGTAGLGISPVFAQECNVSGHPNHPYVIENKRVLATSKHTITSNDGISTTVFKDRREIDVQGPEPACKESFRYVFHVARADFERVRKNESGEVSVSLSPYYENRTGAGHRACLLIPVKNNNVLIRGDEAIISMTPDENTEMRSIREEHMYRRQVEECYTFKYGPVKVEAAPLPSKRPAIVEQNPVAAPQKPANLLDILKPLFGG